jgi:hypothetical protein
VFVFEVYDDAAASDVHLNADPVKKYAATAKDVVVKRQPILLLPIAMNIKKKLRRTAFGPAVSPERPACLKVAHSSLPSKLTDFGPGITWKLVRQPMIGNGF